ncbi:MAG: hypothetical protein ACOC6Q_02530 [Patescibacteria group bacterium]
MLRNKSLIKPLVCAVVIMIAVNGLVKSAVSADANSLASSAPEVHFIGQRSSSKCAEHDSYVVPIYARVEENSLPVGTEITARYKIKAQHPEEETHPEGVSWQHWCDADWTDCPNNSTDETVESVATQREQVFDNTNEQIYVLDENSTSNMEVIVNGESFGTHTAVIFGSRWDSEDSWNHDGVIYANGFTRWKPKGEQPGSKTDPCFGTSVVLGPSQIAEPFLEDGYSPNPLRHPEVESISINVDEEGWIAQLEGGFYENGEQLATAQWVLKRIEINPQQMLISVTAHAQVTETWHLYPSDSAYGLGLIGLSSMYADAEKHDSDTQIGPTSIVLAENISTNNRGLWGEETKSHRLPPGESLRLETRTPTTHNTGSPTMCILWKDVQLSKPNPSTIFLPLILKG